jgi:hypothetical protein
MQYIDFVGTDQIVINPKFFIVGSGGFPHWLKSNFIGLSIQTQFSISF